MTDNEFKRAKRASLKRLGLCMWCGKEDAYTMSGRSMCADCCEKMKESHEKFYSNPENAEKKRQHARDVRRKRKEEGRCVACGVKLPENYSYTRCNKCLAKERGYDRKGKRNTDIRGTLVCFQCAKNPPIEGKKLCKECYNKKLKILEKAHKRKAELKMERLKERSMEADC